MESRILQPYDKECMKMAMLKHEETFKEQVYELHRLYRIQKMLMNNLKTSQAQGYNANYATYDHEQQKPRRKLDLERPAEEYIMNEAGGNKNNGMLETEDENDIELTLGLGPTSFRQQQRKSKDDTSLNSETGPSFSSSSNESSYVQRRNTNNNTRKRGDNRDEQFSAGNKWGGLINNCDVDEQLRQERQKQSPWLFRVMSLNMT
ncbi:hypothetical protein C5167_010069 [Papaver somniferum]|uniref:Uncharacterized protein n=1 Tax=Papaver somniferum TaxID=3469 RepID=A0A4Y7K219_PAPSO|nr:uncharacterized protein LOC113288608 [Papaver somniferum]XP_026393485.1 uncharacterized protein LOC113288608 [Papaver somniferum]RZC66380.1 hypothetical protein C5167_010069 [Papaver somniferum]